MLSQPAYILAFPEMGWYRLNILFTLLLCLLVLAARERITRKSMRVLAILGLVLLSLVCDWAVLLPIYTLLFAWAGSNARKRTWAFLWATLLFGAMNLLGGIGRFTLAANLGYALAGMSGMVLAMFAICCLYNGKRATRGRTAMKWFFYVFYPAHLLVLGVLRLLIG